MGKTRGKPKKGQLADMTIKPPPDPPYQLPPPDEMEEFTWPVVLAPRHELRVRQNIWSESIIAEFAIMQIVLIDAKWREVARIDTCHSVVHKHYLSKARPEDTVGIRELLEPIPSESGWEVVDRWYEQGLKLMQDQWQENLKRWGGDNE